jgi:putative endonuclease
MVRTSGFSARGGPPSGWHPKKIMWFVYLIQSSIDRTFYIGYTENLKKRIIEHNQGKTKSIKNKIPYKLIYFEAYSNKTLARKRELELKNNSYRKKELLDRFK